MLQCQSYCKEESLPVLEWILHASLVLPSLALPRLLSSILCLLGQNYAQRNLPIHLVDALRHALLLIPKHHACTDLVMVAHSIAANNYGE